MEQSNCKVTFVNPIVSQHEFEQIISEIERIAYEIAQECDSDELCELDAI